MLPNPWLAATTFAPVKDVPNAIPIGKAEILQHGENDRIAIFALGALVPMAEELARKLEAEGYPAAVINAKDGRTMRHASQ